MQNLVASLIAHLSPQAHVQAASRADLDAIIERLQTQQADLLLRLKDQALGPRQRRMKTDLEVIRLQLKKARALQSDPSRH